MNPLTRYVDDDEAGQVLCSRHGYYWPEDGCHACSNEDIVTRGLRLQSASVEADLLPGEISGDSD